MKRACAHTRNGSLSPLVYEPIDERKRLIGRQRPTGCTGSLGILRYPDERFILSLLHSRHLLRGVRAIFELPFSLCLSISVPLSLYLRISLSSAILPLRSSKLVKCRAFWQAREYKRS